MSEKSFSHISVLSRPHSASQFELLEYRGYRILVAAYAVIIYHHLTLANTS